MLAKPFVEERPLAICERKLTCGARVTRDAVPKLLDQLESFRDVEFEKVCLCDHRHVNSVARRPDWPATPFAATRTRTGNAWQQDLGLRCAIARGSRRLLVIQRYENKRKRMGIEPTMPLLAQSIIGFEDRGRHQSGTRFRR